MSPCQAPGSPVPGSRTRRQTPAGAGPGVQQEKDKAEVEEEGGLSFRYVLSSVTSYTVLLDQTRDMGLHNR